MRRQGQSTELKPGDIPSLDTLIEGPDKPAADPRHEASAPVPRRPVAVSRPMPTLTDDPPTIVAGGQQAPASAPVGAEPPTVPGLRSGARPTYEDPPTVPGSVGRPGTPASGVRPLAKSRAAPPSAGPPHSTLRGVPPVGEDPPTVVATGRARASVEAHPTFSDEDESTIVGSPPDLADFTPSSPVGDEVLRRIGVEIEAMIDQHPTVVRDVVSAAPVSQSIPARAVIPAPMPQAYPPATLDAWDGDPTPAALIMPSAQPAPPAEPIVFDGGTDPSARSLMTRLPAAPLPPPADASAVPASRQRSLPTEQIGLLAAGQAGAIGGTDANLRSPTRRLVPLAIVGIVLVLGGVLFGVYHAQKTEADAVEAALRAVHDAQESAQEAKRIAKRARDAQRAAQQQQQQQQQQLAVPVGAPPAAALPPGVVLPVAPGVAPVLTSTVPGAIPAPALPGAGVVTPPGAAPVPAPGVPGQMPPPVGAAPPPPTPAVPLTAVPAAPAAPDVPAATSNPAAPEPPAAQPEPRPPRPRAVP
ncbi:MAG: hypothetical protein HY996_03960, partial [Micrococcales bacterium]|nr:hypothetical protein [Micrococcales bacterium]